MHDSQIRLHNICKELSEICALHGSRFVFGFHFQLHNERNQIVDSFSLSNMPQNTLLENYVRGMHQILTNAHLRNDAMATFAVGTKVVCINDKYYDASHTDPIPEYGQVLTVKQCLRGLITSDAYLQFEEMETKNPLNGYHVNRFISYNAWLGLKTKLQ